MANFQELTDKLTEINTAITDERTEVQGLLVALLAQIAALQEQIAIGSPVTQDQLDGLYTEADAIVARVRAISEPE
jgi:primosomal protein N''